ncbi:MAG: alpha/beta hydrolase [Bacteroidota bacterium]
MENVRILTIPGLASSGPGHWQTLWERKFPATFRRVEQENWDLPDCKKWVDKLNDEIQKTDKPTYLVAHSLGCITVVHWASRFVNPNILGALLVAPADVENAKNLSFVYGFNPIPTRKLPFESILIASTNDIYANISRSQEFAKSWGSEFINIGEKGHINASSSIGFWKDGFSIFTQNFKSLLLSDEVY